jgi:hypothetical protein
VRFAFERLPGPSSDVARPAAEVSILGPVGAVTTLGLVDTGSLHNRFRRWTADLAGIDITGAEERAIGIGGTTITALTVVATLQLAEFQWEAPVSFCDPWPFDFQLLGQQGFLRWFIVHIDAANETFEIVPHTQ